MGGQWRWVRGFYYFVMVLGNNRFLFPSRRAPKDEDNGVSPLDPMVSGGDLFDLEELLGLPGSENVDFNRIRYLKIKDVSVGFTDSEGDTLPDPVLPGGNGFDLDAIAMINTIQDATPTGIASRQWEDYR